MAKTLTIQTLAVLLLLTACGGPSGPTPEEFALQVARIVAEGDWPAYEGVALARARMLATDSNPTASQGAFQGLVGAEDEQIRRDFDRTVRAQVVAAEDLGTYEAVVFATEPDRWVLHIHDATGRPTGLEMTLVRFQESYRVATLFAR